MIQISYKSNHFRLNQCVMIQHLFVILTVAFSQIASTLFTALWPIVRSYVMLWPIVRSYVMEISNYLSTSYQNTLRASKFQELQWSSDDTRNVVYELSKELSLIILRIPEPNPASSIKYDVKRDKHTGYIYCVSET